VGWSFTLCSRLSNRLYNRLHKPVSGYTCDNVLSVIQPAVWLCVYLNIMQSGLQTECWRLQTFNVFDSCNPTSSRSYTVNMSVYIMKSVVPIRCGKPVVQPVVWCNPHLTDRLTCWLSVGRLSSAALEMCSKSDFGNTLHAAARRIPITKRNGSCRIRLPDRIHHRFRAFELHSQTSVDDPKRPAWCVQ
jgi:hypothetical protein